MIFPLIWRVLPGPRWFRFMLAVLLVAALVVACFTWVFPWIADDVLPPPDGSVGTP